MGKTQSKPLAARHDRGTAWARHAMCESALTPHIAAIGTAWSLLGSPRNGQATLYLFQNHLMYWVYICSFRADVSEKDRHGLAVQAQFCPS